MCLRISCVLAAVTAVLFVTGPAPLRAQSLADVARQEEARRREIKQPSKVYTNKDLGSVPSRPAPPAGAADTAGGAAPKDGKAGSDAAAKPPADAASKEKPKDQAYWSGRMKTLLSQLDQDEIFAEALQSRINGLTADFSARDDPAQRDIVARDRQKSVDELERVRKRIEDGKKAIADLQEEARRASVPPGWLR